MADKYCVEFLVPGGGRIIIDFSAGKIKYPLSGIFKQTKTTSQTKPEPRVRFALVYQRGTPFVYSVYSTIKSCSATRKYWLGNVPSQAFLVVFGEPSKDFQKLFINSDTRNGSDAKPTTNPT